MSKKEVLPHYSRFIPASFKSNLLVLSLVYQGVACVVLVALFAFLFFTYGEMKIKRSQEMRNLATWERVVEKHPTYPQAYYEAALHAARLNDTEKANEYVSKALLLNSNYEPAKQLQDTLRN